MTFETPEKSDLLASANLKIDHLTSERVMEAAMDKNEDIDDITTNINKAFDLEGKNAFSTQELIAICRDAVSLRSEYLSGDKSPEHPYNNTAFARLMKRATLDTKNNIFFNFTRLYKGATGDDFPTSN